MAQQLFASRTKTGTGDPSRPLRLRLPGLILALAAAGLFSGPVSGAFIGDTGHEPGNDLLTGAETGTATDTFFGCVDACGDNQHNPTGIDPEDFVEFSPLVNLGIYRLNLSRDFNNSSPEMDFDLYFNGVFDHTVPLNASTGNVPNLTGLASLAVGIHLAQGAANNSFEGYNVSLTRTGTRTTVPEPASLALVAAGLAGALVSRRKKRS